MFRYTDWFEFGGQFTQVLFFRYQTGEPFAILSVVPALFDHGQQKAKFSTFAPEFVGIASEVEPGFGYFSPFRLLSLRSVRLQLLLWNCGKEDYRWLHRSIHPEQWSFKYLSAIPLQPEFYLMGQCRIASYNLSCIINGDRINIGTDESPSIFCLSDNGVDTVGTYTDIKTPAWVSGFCCCFCLYRVFGLNQIRYVMDIVCSSRNGRTQVILRNIQYRMP